jgi:hypothetical protein
VFGLDVWLRYWHGVFEYTSDPDCIFRLQFTRLQYPVVLVDGTILDPGDRIARIHLWNEHIPPLPANGATLRWARRMSRHLDISLRDLAQFLGSRRDLEDVRAVQADMMFGTDEQTEQLLHICGSFGFRAEIVTKPPSVAKLLHRYLENMLIACMILAQNPKAFRPDCFRRARVSVFMPRAELDERYRIAGSGQE